MALVCLAAGVVPGWVRVLPEASHPWAFASVVIIAVGAVVMTVRSAAPMWIKVAAGLVGVVAAWIAVVFAGLSFMMDGV